MFSRASNFTGEDAVNHGLGIAAPAQDNDQLALRLDEDDVAAGSARRKVEMKKHGVHGSLTPDEIEIPLLLFRF